MPTFQNSTSQESIKVFLNSAHASIALSDSHVYFHLKDKIHTLNGHHIKLSVLDAEIPFSFYQTNSTNNVLSGSIGGSAFSFTVSPGNYTAFEIVDDLNAKFTAASLTCTVSYSKITNRLTFTAGGGVAIVLNAASTMLEQLGFSSTGTLTGTTTLVSSQAVNLQPTRVLFIKIQNLNVSNRYDNSTSKVIASVPIDVERNSWVFYTAHSNISSEIIDSYVDILEVVIVDEEDNEVEFNGVHWSMTLGFVFDSMKAVPPRLNTVEQERDALEEYV